MPDDKSDHDDEEDSDIELFEALLAEWELFVEQSKPPTIN